MGCEEEAVGSEDQQVRLIKADSSGKQEEEMKVILSGLLFLIFSSGFINCLNHLFISGSFNRHQEMKTNEVW